MTQSIESMIEVLQAYKDGKKVEFRNATYYPEWTACDSTGPAWNFYESEYRIAPEPKKKVKYMCFDDTFELRWWREDKGQFPKEWTRVPSEDKEVEL